MDDERKLWDQLPNEPDRAYARFLVYRNLGPLRSVAKAYNQAVEIETAQKRQKTSASGAWSENSNTYRWAERAAAWDVAMLSEVGQGAVVAFVQALQAYAQIVLGELTSGRLKPKDFRQLTEALGVLGGFIPAETVEAVQLIAASGGIPAVGSGGASAAESD